MGLHDKGAAINSMTEFRQSFRLVDSNSFRVLTGDTADKRTQLYHNDARFMATTTGSNCAESIDVSNSVHKILLLCNQ